MYFKAIYSIIKRYPILLPSLVISLIYMITLSTYISPKYKSESIISVSSSDESGSVSSALGFVSNFLGSDINQSIGDLKTYLESDNAVYDLKKLIKLESIFLNNDIDFFSRYKPNARYSLKDFLKKVIILKTDDSGNLLIETYAYTSQDAYKLNLALIMLSSNYFDKRQNLSSKIAIQKDICQYQMSKNGFPFSNLDELIQPDNKPSVLIDIESYNSANDMLLQKAESFMTACNTDEKGAQLIDIPNNTLRDLNNESLKQLIGNIYSKSISAITMSDAIEIVAEPSINSKTESKNIILKSTFMFIFMSLSIITLLIIFKLRNDFKL
jgi:hypothetical protein